MEANYFTILYWSCHTLTWILHGCTCVSHPEPPSHLPPYPIPLGYPSAPAPSTLSHASNLDWQFITHMIIYMFQCHSPKSSHPSSFFTWLIYQKFNSWRWVAHDQKVRALLTPRDPNSYISKYKPIWNIWCKDLNKSMKL